jgi:hypothetical protein
MHTESETQTHTHKDMYISLIHVYTYMYILGTYEDMQTGKHRSNRGNPACAQARAVSDSLLTPLGRVTLY